MAANHSGSRLRSRDRRLTTARSTGLASQVDRFGGGKDFISLDRIPLHCLNKLHKFSPSVLHPQSPQTPHKRLRSIAARRLTISVKRLRRAIASLPYQLCLIAFLATIALPSSLVAPVETSHGCQVLISSDCRCRDSNVHLGIFPTIHM